MFSRIRYPACSILHMVSRAICHCSLGNQSGMILSGLSVMILSVLAFLHFSTEYWSLTVQAMTSFPSSWIRVHGYPVLISSNAEYKIIRTRINLGLRNGPGADKSGLKRWLKYLHHLQAAVIKRGYHTLVQHFPLTDQVHQTGNESQVLAFAIFNTQYSAGPCLDSNPALPPMRVCQLL